MANAPYEAHIVKADGTSATVKMNADFKVTGIEAGGPGGHGRTLTHPEGGPGTDAIGARRLRPGCPW